ncbi:MAG: hypothetical protein WBE86_05095 [Candidatus Acidiferrales bacterium]
MLINVDLDRRISLGIVQFNPWTLYWSLLSSTSYANAGTNVLIRIEETELRALFRLTFRNHRPKLCPPSSVAISNDKALRSNSPVGVGLLNNKSRKMSDLLL